MKRPAKSFRLALTACLGAGWLLVVANAPAQTAPPEKPKSPASGNTGQVTKGFSLPQYTDGKLTALIAGSEARVISVNRTEITDLKVELYEDGKVDTTITSPKSDYWTADNKMRTRYTVQINRAEMTITAQTMEWEVKEKRGTLRQNVKVVLNNLDLAQPASTPNPAASAPLTGSDGSSLPSAPSSEGGLMLQPSAPATGSSSLTPAPSAP